jgi:hypothetical protein
MAEAVRLQRIPSSRASGCGAKNHSAAPYRVVQTADCPTSPRGEGQAACEGAFFSPDADMARWVARPLEITGMLPRTKQKNRQIMFDGTSRWWEGSQTSPNSKNQSGEA